MIENKPISEAKNALYKVAVILLVAVAAYSSAMKELNRLQELVGGVHEFASEWLGDLATLHAATMSLEESSQSACGPKIYSIDEFRGSGPIATGGSIEINGASRDIDADPATSGKVEVLANKLVNKKAHRSDPKAVEIRVAGSADGVTINAIYPSNQLNDANTCEPGKGGRMNVRDNHVRVNYSAKVPAGAGFAGTVNGEISATALSGNVIANTFNRSIKIATSGYAKAKTINGEIPAKLRNANWPNIIEFNTIDGASALDFSRLRVVRLKQTRSMARSHRIFL